MPFDEFKWDGSISDVLETILVFIFEVAAILFFKAFSKWPLLFFLFASADQKQIGSIVVVNSQRIARIPVVSLLK